MILECECGFRGKTAEVTDGVCPRCEKPLEPKAEVELGATVRANPRRRRG